MTISAVQLHMRVPDMLPVTAVCEAWRASPMGGHCWTHKLCCCWQSLCRLTAHACNTVDHDLEAMGPCCWATWRVHFLDTALVDCCAWEVVLCVGCLGKRCWCSWAAKHAVLFIAWTPWNPGGASGTILQGKC